MASEAMKVGELAGRTGLSVRTLHHYDDIGLLTPAARTPSGHRIYGMAEVRRLQQIASLRHLGLSLDEIRDCLERPEYSLERILEIQIVRMREEIDRQRRLIALLEGLRGRLAAAEQVSVEDVVETIEGTLRHEKYFSPEQRAALARRAGELGEERILRAQSDWAELFDAFARAMERDADPASPEVQVLATRASDLIEQFTGGDPGIRASVTRMYREEGGESIMAGHGTPLPAGLWEYYGRALAVRGAES